MLLDDGGRLAELYPTAISARLMERRSDAAS